MLCGHQVPSRSWDSVGLILASTLIGKSNSSYVPGCRLIVYAIVYLYII